jgi:hypothetical protein
VFSIEEVEVRLADEPGRILDAQPIRHRATHPQETTLPIFVVK